MNLHRCLSIALLWLFLCVSWTSSLAAPLSDEAAGALASAFVEADYDERQIAYQLALAKIQMIQLLDAELTKAKPSPLMTTSSPAWKAARKEFLEKMSAALNTMMAKSRMVPAYKRMMLANLSSEEAQGLLSFLKSPEGQYFSQAKRLLGRQKAIESYALAISTSRIDLPELLAEPVQSDMNQLASEAKSFGKPTKEMAEKTKALIEGLAWPKLQRIITAAALESMAGLAASGGLDNLQGLAQQVVQKAVSDFKAAPEAQAK